MWQMDPEIAGIFGKDSSLNALPDQLRWSPDSRRIAFLRPHHDRRGISRTELWLHDVERDVASPLLVGEDIRVTEYAWIDEGRIAAIANDDVWIVPLKGSSQQATRTATAESDLEVSPDGTKVAYLRDHNIILLDLVAMMERPLTRGGHPRHTFGEVTWLYGEEFGTERGFEWSPDSRYLWFMETDLSKVSFRGIDLSNGDIDAMPYPRPGEPNPAIKIAILDVAVPNAAPIYLADGTGKDIYLPRVKWHPGSRHIFFTELDRLQTSLTLISCAVDTRKCSTVVEESDPRYIDLLDDPVFISGGNELLRLSKVSGYAHIHRVRLDTFAATPVTRGAFEVFKINHVDEKRGTVVFTANAENTGEHKLYAVSLFGGELRSIPQESGCHDTIFSPDGTQYIDTHSAMIRPTKVVVKTSAGDTIATIGETSLRKDLSESITNETFPIDTEDDIPIMAHLTRPTTLEPGIRYPVLVIVYGGPQVQLTRNAFHLTYQPWRNLLAKRGILVFTVDGRGSYGRGHDFESAIRAQLGKVELVDQLTGIAHLKSLPFVDSKRIGIFGWSYGGYMVLNALLRTKNIFKLGVSVAPVTDWRFYDTAYTERYMQRPEDNAEGYRSTSLIPLAPRLASPLLLVHGIADNNVHLIHTHRMLSAFTHAGRYVEQAIYPGKNHKIGGPDTRVHLFTRITRFIEDHL